jgi:hypothetical protein
LPILYLNFFSTGDIRPEAFCEETGGADGLPRGELEGTNAVRGNLSAEVDRDRDGIVDKVESEPPTPEAVTPLSAGGGDPSAVTPFHQPDEEPQLSIATFDEWTKEKLMRGQHFQVKINFFTCRKRV